MEYLFGTTVHGYDDLYCDPVDKRQKLHDFFVKLRSDIGNNNKLYGYHPDGTNGMIPMFFKYDQYKFAGRDVYYVHAVSLGENYPYYQSPAFFDGFSYRFVDDEEIKNISTQLSSDNSSKIWQNRASTQTALNINTYKKPMVQTLKTIVYNLLKQRSLNLVMEGESYDKEDYRILMRDIFGYLPYSLRRWCSFITAATVNKSFKVVIISDKTTTIPSDSIYVHRDLSFDASADAESQVVDYLFSLNPQQRKQLFDDYEMVVDPNENFRSDKFVRFVNALQNDGENCDFLLREFLNRGHAHDTMLPESIRRRCAPYYMNPSNLDEIFQVKAIVDQDFISDPMAFWDKHEEKIVFTYILNPNADAYFRGIAADIATMRINHSVYEIAKNIKLYTSADLITNSLYEQKMMDIFNELLTHVANRAQAWGKQYEALERSFDSYYKQELQNWWFDYKQDADYMDYPDDVERYAWAESEKMIAQFRAGHPELDQYGYDKRNHFDFRYFLEYTEKVAREKCATIRSKYAEALENHQKRQSEAAQRAEAERLLLEQAKKKEEALQDERDKFPQWADDLYRFNQFLLGEGKEMDYNALIRHCPNKDVFILENYFARYLNHMYRSGKKDFDDKDSFYTAIRRSEHIPDFSWKRVGKCLEKDHDAPYLSACISIKAYSDIIDFVQYLIDMDSFEKIDPDRMRKLEESILRKVDELQRTTKEISDCQKAYERLKKYLADNRKKTKKTQLLCEVRKRLENIPKAAPTRLSDEGSKKNDSSRDDGRHSQDRAGTDRAQDSGSDQRGNGFSTGNPKKPKKTNMNFLWLGIGLIIVVLLVVVCIIVVSAIGGSDNTKNKNDSTSGIDTSTSETTTESTSVRTDSAEIFWIDSLRKQYADERI